MSLELFVRSLYTRTAVARHPCFSWVKTLICCSSKWSSMCSIQKLFSHCNPYGCAHGIWNITQWWAKVN